MGVLTEQQFMQSIKKKELKPVYFLYGPERYMLDGCIGMLQKAAVTGQALLNFARLDGAKATLDQLINETETLPVLSHYRCVLVEDMQIDKLGKIQTKQLFDLINDLPDTTVLAFVFTETEINLKRSAAYRKFADLVSSIGHVVEFKHKTKSDLVKLLIKQAAKQQGELSREAAQELIARTGTELTPLLAELEKLVAFAGGAEINKAHVQMLVVQNLDSSAFDMAKAVLQNQHLKAFSLLHELFLQKQEEISILAALNTSFMDIYRAKCTQMSGQQEGPVLKAYSYRGKEFRMRNAMRDCSRYSMTQIRSCIDCLMEADLKMKSSRVDNRILLETAVGKMMVSMGGAS